MATLVLVLFVFVVGYLTGFIFNKWIYRIIILNAIVGVVLIIVLSTAAASNGVDISLTSGRGQEIIAVVAYIVAAILGQRSRAKFKAKRELEKSKSQNGSNVSNGQK